MKEANQVVSGTLIIRPMIHTPVFKISIPKSLDSKDKKDIFVYR